MSDSEVVDLTLEDEPKPSAGSAPQLDLAALAREREARRQSRGDDGGDAKRSRVASTPAAPTGDGVSGAAKGSGKHCMVASGANCGDTYRVMYSHDTPDGVESDGACETYFKPLLDSAKARCRSAMRGARWSKSHASPVLRQAQASDVAGFPVPLPLPPRC